MLSVSLTQEARVSLLQKVIAPRLLALQYLHCFRSLFQIRDARAAQRGHSKIEEQESFSFA